MFSAESKRIFQYFNGEKQVYADPIEINRAIFHELGDVPALIEKTKAPNDDVAYQAMNKFVAGARAAFGMPTISPETGKGATFDEVLAAWEDFVLFMQKKNPLPANTPMSLPPSLDQPPSSSIPEKSPPSPAKTATASSSDCGCI